MEGRGDRQRQRALGALSAWRAPSRARPRLWFRRSRPVRRHCRWRPRRSRRSDRARSPPRAAIVDDFGEIEAEDRRHRALADRNGLLHRLAADAQQPRRVLDRQRAGGAERGIFAERMAGDEGGVAGDDRARPRSRARAAPPGSSPSAPAARWRSASARPPGPRRSGATAFVRAPRRRARTPRAPPGRRRRAPCPCRPSAIPVRETRGPSSSPNPSLKKSARKTRPAPDCQVRRRVVQRFERRRQATTREISGQSKGRWSARPRQWTCPRLKNRRGTQWRDVDPRGKQRDD